jgi:protein involved in polysaccharide export with SLBB domain
MTKFILITCGIALSLFLNGCSQVLESVNLLNGSEIVNSTNDQEDFNINIKSLTFKNAQEANSDPYPRKLMLTGNGSRANVFNEADFLNSNFPPSTPAGHYLLGVGDKLSFHQLNEYAVSSTNLPNQKVETDYLLGVGDELTFVQMNQAVNNLNIKDPNTTLNTSSVVDTNGNILLLGLGSIQAENKPLNSIQTEVRNILIRNGLAPYFQLEITGFNSKKAFVTSQDDFIKRAENIIQITNLPVTLKEILMSYGLGSNTIERLSVTLSRNGQTFRMTAGQIFDNQSNRIVIQDRDQISIHYSELSNTRIEAVVGSNSNVLLPGIGSLKAENRSLADLRADITHILLKGGMKPKFQLEITEFKSKKFSIITMGQKSKVIALTDSQLSLKEAILANENILFNEGTFGIVNLIRNGETFQITLQEIFDGFGANILIQDGDTVELESFKYKEGQVFALSGAGKAQLVPINPSRRETLADILFTSNGALNNLLAKRSEVYLLRGQNPLIAYHLDAQNVSRILVAANTELRPNDIVYVADRPIISFARTLSEISPLRILLRDIQNDNIP